MIAGLLGVGGGIVLVPAFLYTFLALGYDGPQIMQVCLATSLATIVFTSQRSVRGAREEGRGRLRHPARLGTGHRHRRGGRACIVAGGMKTTALMVIFGVLGTLVGLYLAFGRDSWRLGDQMPTGLGRAEAREGLDEAGGRLREELRAGLVRHRFGQQGLAGTGRAVQQDPLGDAGAELAEAVGLGQELDDFAQLRLRLVDAGHLVPLDGGRGVGLDLLRLRLGHDLHHSPQEKDDQAHEQDR